MNNEERLLYTCLNKSNFLKEMPMILEYLDNCYINVIEVNRNKSFKIEENVYIDFVIEYGINYYYSSKLKLYFDLEEYEDEEPKVEKKEKV